MDFSIIGTTYKLIFMCIIKGTYGVTIYHHESKTAVEGQNISLHCIVEEQDIIDNKVNIIQMEWIKSQQGMDKKIAVFHPEYPIQYFKNDSFVEGRNSSTGKLKGTVLNLFKVKVNDSGNYICEMTSYPHGSIRKITVVNITEPTALKMLYPYGFVKEGDEVKMRCSASGLPLRYELRRSKDESFLLESQSGEFILPNVARNNSDLYYCFPVWKSSGQNRQGFNSTLELTVHFLDSAECNTSSPLRLTVGEDVAISCKTKKASQPLLYKWMKGNTTLSSSDVLSLSSVTSNQSGTYKLTTAFYNNQLWTDTEISIHVLPEMSKGFTTDTTSSVRTFSTLHPFFSQTTEPLSNFTSVETSSAPTTLTTSESGHFLSSTPQPNATMTTKHSHTSPDSLLNDSSSASPVGNASTLHPDFVNPSNTSFSFNASTTSISQTGSKLGTFVVTSKTTIIYTTGKTVRIEEVSKRATYIVIPILFLLLILIVLLYRRNLTKKKMNMPPSFKPPPPPVKYTSVRNHDILMNDVLV